VIALRPRARLLAVLAWSVLAACSAGADKRELAADAASKPASTPAGPKANFSGVIRGIVKLADGSSVPLGADPRGNPGTVEPPAPCAPISEADRRVVYAAEGTHGLTPIHVALTGMKSVPPSAPTTRVVRALGCRFQPDLAGAQVGDTLRFENASAAVLTTAFPGDTFIRTLPAGDAHEVKVGKSGVLQVGCPLGGYCGGTSIIAVAHPLWAVTDQAGTFRIAHVPLGEPVVVHAWHPLFGESNATLTLDATTPEREVTLTLTPLPQPPSAPSPTPVAPAPSGAGAKPRKGASR
jgi:plastocyanin